MTETAATGKMTPMEAVEQALAHLGPAPAEDLTAFILERFGVRVQSRFLPIIREMLEDRKRRAEALRSRPSADPPAEAPAAPAPGVS